MRYEPALKYALIVGLIGVLLRLVGIEITDGESRELDAIIGMLFVFVPLVESLVQGWLTRRKVTPVARLEDDLISN